MHQETGKYSERETQAGFLPSRDGFAFPNRFPIGRNAVYGLCGGMVAAALDFKLANRTIPKDSRPPKAGTPLHNYLVKRQLESLTGGKQVLRLISWIFQSDKEIQRFTSQQLEKICALLSEGKCVPLGLVYKHDKFRNKIAVWQDHQVLATGYHIKDERLNISVYDPNFPGNDHVYIQIESKENGVNVRELIKIDDRWGYLPVRGLLTLPYRHRQPRS